MGRIAPWTERLWGLVEDGPVAYDHALVEMARLVPPGRAFRNTTRIAEWKRPVGDDLAINSSKREAERSKDALIRQGKIALARSAIWTQTKQGRVEEFFEDGQRMLRKGPFPARSPSRVRQPSSRDPNRGVPAKMSKVTLHTWRRVGGGPVPYEVLLEEVLALIPEADALRSKAIAIKSDRKRHRSRRVDIPIGPLVGADHVRAGRLRIARRTLQQLAARGRITQYASGDVEMVDRGPSFWSGEPPPA